MELQILLILAIGLIVLGPERMINLAVEIGKFMRNLRDTWEELKYEAYMESLHRELIEGQKEEDDKGAGKSD